MHLASRENGHPYRWLALFLTALLMLTSCIVGDSVSEEEKAQAIRAATEVFAREQARGMDFSAGPCIAERLEALPDWSVDIAHDPRQDIDDRAENQCQAYRDGRTHHFVELDPTGRVIKAR